MMICVILLWRFVNNMFLICVLSFIWSRSSLPTFIVALLVLLGESFTTIKVFLSISIVSVARAGHLVDCIRRTVPIKTRCHSIPSEIKYHFFVEIVPIFCPLMLLLLSVQILLYALGLPKKLLYLIHLPWLLFP